MKSKIRQLTQGKKDFLVRILKIFHLDSLLYRVLFKSKIAKEHFYVKEISRIESLTMKEQSKLQNEKLLEIFEIAFNSCTYYRKLFDEKQLDHQDIATLKLLPSLTKKVIVEEYEDLINANIDRKTLSVRHTGGTTGTPFEFRADKNAELIDNAHHWYLYEKMGYKQDDLIINSLGIEISQKDRDRNIYWKHTYKENVWGEYIFSTLYLNEKTVKFYVEKILELQPKILRGIPSFYNIISQYIIDNDLKVDFTPLGVNLTSEYCSLQVQDKIENTFRCSIYFEYGHREISLYCYTGGKSNEYKSSAMYGYIEVLEEDGSDTPLGGIGRIVTTGLINKGMPFIRYETGDLGCVVKREGGIVHFSSIEGRSQDYIMNERKEKFFMTSILPQIVYNKNYFKNVKEWQIEQEKIGEITLYIVKDDKFLDSDATEIKRAFLDVFDMKVEIEFLASINVAKSGKRLFIVQKSIKDEN